MKSCEGRRADLAFFPGHPNLNLSTEEKRVYTTLLKEADPDGFGAVSGDVAVKFFERTKLPPEILGQVCCSDVPDETGTLFKSQYD